MWFGFHNFVIVILQYYDVELNNKASIDLIEALFLFVKD